ncbi:hypothetical protein VCRA2113O324_160097 [Vibrio crassostreae]|nr:hypothetical protein VCRA2111O320_160097 [Vibrio crassostreae]CAK1798374.1 hypothetical protein VCRA2113O324_160097 [Vibrio crassostreae]CAK1805807.1 hypothetical protein VCRA2113O322_170072 [Vibrio crassostreae]CAK1840858.1 hypothetical protein VCRA2113O326_190072 [Vibrio crassostreae]CAK2602034.1 hypothetical protein VCRA2113O323_170072 [Vibrio crassostreae]
MDYPFCGWFARLNRARRHYFKVWFREPVEIELGAFVVIALTLIILEDSYGWRL